MSFCSIIRPAIVASVAIAASLLVSAPADADVNEYFPIASSDQRTLRAQKLVEELYESRQYKRSRIIYEKDLAPIGDKYAQYMVGYMLINGQGSAVDRPAALAWYRLAAERGEPLIIRERDVLFRTMSDKEIVRSNEIFVSLWREIGDNRLILDLVQKDLRTLQHGIESRLAAAGANSIAPTAMQNGSALNDASYVRVQKRITMRVKYLDANAEIVDVDLKEEFAVKRSLEIEIKEEMAALDIQ